MKSYNTTRCPVCGAPPVSIQGKAICISPHCIYRILETYARKAVLLS